MKRLLILLFFCTTIPWLTASGSTKKEPRSAQNRNSIYEVIYDTTGFISLIKADSFNLALLVPSSGVQFYKDGIVFLSSTKYEEKMSPIHVSFGATEAYFAIPGDTATGKHILFSPSASFSFPCDAITFSQDFNTMYFTQIPKKDKKEKIFMAKFTSESGWLLEKLPLDFCTGNFTYTHPALSADEKVLVFASDREGSLGGMDLFITKREGDNWSEPENLGNLINTTGNELFPFLDSENNLFFSSDGISGYGGYDIFTSRFNGDTWDEPINLSGRINSEYDDIAFTINKIDGKSAFYTRRKKTGKGEMQLFRVTLKGEVADSNLLTFSYIFHGKPQVKSGLLTANTVAQVETPKEEPLIAENKTAVIDKRKVAELPKNKVPPARGKKNPGAVTPASKPAIPEKTITKEQKKPSQTVLSETKDLLIYRVQFFSSKTSKGKYQITVNNKIYDTFEYLYLKEYRSTVGEFKTLAPAVELQNTLRKEGYPNAFVIVFKNNVRSLDPNLFK